MTPIQAGSLPLILEGKDVIAQAKTGSGKTAAFGLGILSKLDMAAQHIQALVLCPTRELADQVAKEIRALARMTPNTRVLTLCGGMPVSTQVNSLKRPVHVAVGTPGRIEDLLGKAKLSLGGLSMLVLDEADRMLDMGFQPSIDFIVKQLPRNRQTLLFSATYPEKIDRIARRVMRNPRQVETDTSHDDTSIQQHFYQVKNTGERLTACRLLLMQQRPTSALVFCNTKREADRVAKSLKDDGFSALALHSDFDQRERQAILTRFSNKSISVLVATDVAARGLDINNVDAIINYDMAHDPEVHVHRVGRTGRAGSTGCAYSICTNKDDYVIESLEEILGRPIQSDPLPPRSLLSTPAYKPAMATLEISGGKSNKLRPGDIVGALTGKNGIDGNEIGDITIFDRRTYVAVNKAVIHAALSKLNDGKIKGRSFRVSRI